MGWRDFQETPPQEFMESMELMNSPEPLLSAAPQREFMEFMEFIPIEPPLIPLIPLIPIAAGFKNRVDTRQPDTTTAFCTPYGGHCSVKVTGAYPADCIRTKCEHYTGQAPRRTCYSCKGPDFWESAVTETPRFICRRCHPPAPGAERIRQ